MSASTHDPSPEPREEILREELAIWLRPRPRDRIAVPAQGATLASPNI